MVSNNIKYAIVLDRRTERVIVIKLNPADFLDEEIEECDWEQILYPYEEEGKFDLTLDIIPIEEIPVFSAVCD